MHLTECLEHIHNYFYEHECETLQTYTIANGAVSPLSGLADGDRFRICGSRRNDGIYTYHADGIRNDDDDKAAGLRDETFAGTIRVMAVPPAVVTLSGEKKAWEASFGAQLNSPIGSESFNGYSYSLKTGKNGGALTWFDTPAAAALERWRRPFV